MWMRLASLKAFSPKPVHPFIHLGRWKPGDCQVAGAEKSVDILSVRAEPQDSGEYSWKELYRDPLVA